MTDQIPADKVRDLRDQYARLIEDAGTKEAQAYYGHVVDDLDALLPPPPRPTLADMTPDEARALLDGTTPGDEWHYQVKWGAVRNISPIDIIPGGELDVTEEDAALIVAAPEMAAMIAGMRTEYRTEEWQGSYPGWVPTSPWTAEKPAGSTDPNTRIVPRYIAEPEVTE